MQANISRQVGLYAVVAAEQARAWRPAPRGLRLVTRGPLAAVVGKPEQETQRAALRHDRIVGQALTACASVVPFRLGVVLPCRDELHRVLEANEQALLESLARFHGRVEMALKARLPTPAAGAAPRVPFSLEPLQALAPSSQDRREVVRRSEPGPMFEGCYLIERRHIDTFWQAVAEIRRCVPSLPMLGSGPWAAYSFCDFTLQPAHLDTVALDEPRERVCAR